MNYLFQRCLNVYFFQQLQKLKAENERLKAENRALTRVVSKLTNSANTTK
jgi:cell division protein FtsB